MHKEHVCSLNPGHEVGCLLRQLHSTGLHVMSALACFNQRFCTWVVIFQGNA